MSYKKIVVVACSVLAAITLALGQGGYGRFCEVLSSSLGCTSE